MKMLLYCTKSKPYLYKMPDCYIVDSIDKGCWGFPLNGKIVAECDFEVEEIIFEGYGVGLGYKGTKTNQNKLANESCLYSYRDIDNYLKGKNGYAICIKNLHIFGEPKELNEFYKSHDNSKTWQYVNKAPQNMMNVDYINIDRNIFLSYILISIQPQWLCKILNGKKTIEVRKKVLKEMLK